MRITRKFKPKLVTRSVSLTQSPQRGVSLTQRFASLGGDHWWVLIVIALVASFLFYRLLKLILKIFKRYRNSTRVVPVPKKTILLNTKPDLFGNQPTRKAIFERDDITHYIQTPNFTPDRIVFDLPAGNVQIDNIEDVQNVHCNIVQKYIRKIYEDADIESSRESVSDTDVIAEILEYSGDDPVIRKVLNKIQTRNSNITNVGDKTEMDLLRTIWEKANTDTNIKNFLMTQLKDCEENGSIVCPTGVSTRLAVSTLVNDPESFPKTKDTLNKEMMNTASSIRNELEQDNTYKALLEDEQQEFLKSSILDRYSIDYKGILNENEIKDLTKSWIDHI